MRDGLLERKLKSIKVSTSNPQRTGRSVRPISVRVDPEPGACAIPRPRLHIGVFCEERLLFEITLATAAICIMRPLLSPENKEVRAGGSDRLRPAAWKQLSLISQSETVDFTLHVWMCFYLSWRSLCVCLFILC